MRFARLMLERFGHFEDCTLSFRDGAPDLHIIYGPNEAGKSTTLAAVSDLLFGFGARTPYKFRFDNALLRVGAELEEDGDRIVCRRRRAKPTLVDTADRAMDEGGLLAMLRGQTRDSFRLAFSLDQERLRQGGRAMVEARDDIGQALFAAGSGLTAVAGELDRLNGEADAIWGRRAAQKRTYTAAERDFTESQKRVRDLALKPKAWTDARVAADRALAGQRDIEARRDVLFAEQRRVERLRRVAPALRRRAELLDLLAARGAVRMLLPQRETLALAALAAADAADRDRRTARLLHTEAVDQAAPLTLDAAVLAVAERIDELAGRRGEVAKAAQDRMRLVGERQAGQARIAGLHGELGGETAIPSKLVVAGLRDLARRHAETRSGLHAGELTLADLAAREKPLRDRLADSGFGDALSPLVAAVDAARRLGDDVDGRCAAASRRADQAEALALSALRQLSPWSGTAGALEALATIGDEEIEAAQVARLALCARLDRDGLDIARHAEEAETLLLEREALAGQSGAIAADEVTRARALRDTRWRPLRDHLRDGATLADPGEAVNAVEQAIAAADDIADRRYALAEASGRLAELEARRAGAALRSAQAHRRRDEAATALADLDTRWQARLAAAALPVLEPVRLRAWFGDRRVALEAQAAAVAARDAVAVETDSRAAIHAALSVAMPGETAADPVLLAPVLVRAEALRRDGEARAAAFREDRAELRQIERSLDEQRRRATHATADADRIAAAWQSAVTGAGIDLAIDTADSRLAIVEELRAALDATTALDARMNGIDADIARFDADLGALAADAGEPANGDAVATLTTLRVRLDAAREGQRRLADLAAQRERRQREIDAAGAAHAAAMQSLAPVHADAGLAPGDDVAAAVEASRELRRLREELAEVERQITAAGDGLALLDLVEEWAAADPDQVARRAVALTDELAALNTQVTAAATLTGETARAFAGVEGQPGAAAAAAADAEQARAEMGVQAEAYLLKRTQAVMLRWAMERYRERRQDPMLLRASELFATLTLGRYRQLRIDHDGAGPRLGGLRDDGCTIVGVGEMSEGTTDQLFLALRLAAVEQSIAAGVRLPFLADDLFVNFDDDRARAGFRVLADLARSTQVLFFTHHPHLAAIASAVVGADLHSECTFD